MKKKKAGGRTRIPTLSPMSCRLPGSFACQMEYCARALLSPAGAVLARRARPSLIRPARARASRHKSYRKNVCRRIIKNKKQSTFAGLRSARGAALAPRAAGARSLRALARKSLAAASRAPLRWSLSGRLSGSIDLLQLFAYCKTFVYLHRRASRWITT